MNDFENDGSSYVDPEPSIPPNPDRPITSAAQDRYGRSGLATTIARHLRAAPRGDSMVYGLHGPWGSGKTSVLRLVELELVADGITPLWFNPWYFSGTDQIASQFLRALAAHVRGGRDLEQVGRALESYAESVLDVTSVLGSFVPASNAVATFARLVKSRGNAMTTGGATLIDQKDQIEKALTDASPRIVVFLDDIDRLDHSELRQVFKLVRLVADFPNVTYLLSYERLRVERAISEQEGREYVAKIVQSTFDLPNLAPGVLTRELERGVAELTTRAPHVELHSARWQQVVEEILEPLCRTPRDVRRLLNALGPALELVGEEVALEDLVAMEAMRVFLPSAFERLSDERNVLTNPIGPSAGGTAKERETARLRAFIGTEPSAERLMEDLVCRLFPAGGSLLRPNLHPDLGKARRERRIASPDVLAVYLEKAVGDGRVPSRLVRELVERFADASLVRQKLSTLDYEALADACSRIADFAEDVANVGFVSGFVALTETVDLFPPSSSPLDGAESGLWRLLERVLRAADDQATNDALMRALADSRLSIFRKAWALQIASSDEERRSLVSKEVEVEVAQRLRGDITSLDRAQLLRAPHVLDLLRFASEEESGKAFVAERLQQPEILQRVLAEACRYARVLSRPPREFPFVSWRMLLGLFGGDETVLRQSLVETLRVAPAGASTDKRLSDALHEARALLDGTIEIASEGARQRSSREALPRLASG